MQSTHLDWELFLRRPSILCDRDAISRAINGRRVLITGAGGCIGSALAKECVQLQVESLILLDSSEKGIFELDCDLIEAGSNIPCTSIVGDVCDETLLDETFAMHRPNIVFHAAACKHVPLMEQNPITAARTNVIGTQRVAAAAVRHTAEQLILLSTDKAVDPVSIMGATKRIAELTVLVNSRRTRMKVVRLGNVLGSSGSVVPFFLKQIAQGGPVTVTHAEATRFFITLGEAVSLLLSAVPVEHDSAVLIPEPGEARRISELAKFLVTHTRAQRSPDIPITFTELRSGDKLHERLLSDDEVLIGSSRMPLHVVSGPIPSQRTIHQVLIQIAEAVENRDLENLIRAVCFAVPRYQPSPLLLSQIQLSYRNPQ